MLSNFADQELFEKIDQEDDGEVYLREVVLFLRAVNDDVDNNLKVKNLLDQYDTNGEDVLRFPQFCDIMGELKECGWKKADEKKEAELTEDDIRQIFNLVDIDKSGSVSKREACMACKLLQKRFGIKNVATWLKTTDSDNDGKLSFTEFSKAILEQMESQKVENGH